METHVSPMGGGFYDLMRENNQCGSRKRGEPGEEAHNS
jgi:hypothetical protein